MRACLAEGVSCTDLGGLQRVTAQQFKLHTRFHDKGLLCLTGCGSTPGIANVLMRYASTKLDTIHSVDLGFAWNSEPKVFVIPYSLPSIFAELREKPVIYKKPSFVTCQPSYLIKRFTGIGAQRVQNIAHSEVDTFPRYFPALRSVRYYAGFPEHSRTYLEALMLLDADAPNESKKTLSLLGHLPLPPAYREWETIWLDIKGLHRGKKKHLRMECRVQTIKGWEEAGSNIDTGRTMSIMSQMLFNGTIRETGVHAPEGVVPWQLFFRELEKRNMRVFCNGRPILIH
jgi:lysine 6-dehydrogenase